MSVRDDIVEQLSVEEEVRISNILDKFDNLYQEKCGVKISREKTDTFYFLAQTLDEIHTDLLKKQLQIIENQDIKTMDYPSLIANAEYKGVEIGEGEYTKLNIRVPIVLNNASSVTLYNYNDPDDNNITQIVFTDGTNNFIIDNPKDVLNNNCDNYAVSFTEDGVYDITCRCVEKGAVSPSVGSINAIVGTANYIDATNISNVKSSVVIDDVIVNSDENGIYKTGTNIEDIESIRNRLDIYTTDKEKKGTLSYLQEELYKIGCNLVKIYNNQDYLEHNGVPGNMIAISLLGGSIDNIFKVLEDNIFGTNYHFHAIQGLSYTKTIQRENGYMRLAINRPNSVPVDITLYTKAQITDTLQEKIIEELYEALKEDPLYKEDNVVKIQAIRTYLETILYQNRLDYEFPSIIFTNYPTQTELKGDLRNFYFYEKSTMHIVRIL